MSGTTYTESNLVDVSSGASACPMPAANKGWRASINSLTANTSAGVAMSMLYAKVSSKILQYGGSTVVPLYKPRTDGQCSIGDSAVFLFDTACGFGKQSQSFSGVMIGGVTVTGNTIIMGISGNSGVSTQGSFTKTDNLLVGKGTFNSMSGGTINIYGRQRVR